MRATLHLNCLKKLFPNGSGQNRWRLSRANNHTSSACKPAVANAQNGDIDFAGSLSGDTIHLASSNASWLGNQTPAVTAPLIGLIDFPDFADDGFADTLSEGPTDGNNVSKNSGPTTS